MRLFMIACACAAILFAEGFSFNLGNPVAAQDFRIKGAAFVFRTQGCAEPAKPQISATAEGLVKGARQSLDLKLMPTAQPGVYAVYRTWPAEGEWVVNLKGTCGGADAGAVVPIGPKGFLRETSKFYSRPATGAEIDLALKTLSQGGIK